MCCNYANCFKQKQYHALLLLAFSNVLLRNENGAILLFIVDALFISPSILFVGQVY